MLGESEQSREATGAGRSLSSLLVAGPATPSRYRNGRSEALAHSAVQRTFHAPRRGDQDGGERVRRGERGGGVSLVSLVSYQFVTWTRNWDASEDSEGATAQATIQPRCVFVYHGWKHKEWRLGNSLCGPP